MYKGSRTERPRRPRVMTLEDSQKLLDEETRSRNNAQAAGRGQSEAWGIRALDLTNQFRMSNNLPSISWNQALHDIAMEHCVNMAMGKCPIGHDGFNQRSEKVPFFKRAFRENVAYNFGCPDAV